MEPASSCCGSGELTLALVCHCRPRRPTPSRLISRCTPCWPRPASTLRAPKRFRVWQRLGACGHAVGVWQEPFTELRVPLLTNLRKNPFERTREEHAIDDERWYLDPMLAIMPSGACVGQRLQSFRELPPRQKPGSFNIERVMEAVSKPQGQ